MKAKGSAHGLQSRTFQDPSTGNDATLRVLHLLKAIKIRQKKFSIGTPRCQCYLDHALLRLLSQIRHECVMLTVLQEIMDSTPGSVLQARCCYALP